MITCCSLLLVIWLCLWQLVEAPGKISDWTLISIFFLLDFTTRGDSSFSNSRWYSNTFLDPKGSLASANNASKLSVFSNFNDSLDVKLLAFNASRIFTQLSSPTFGNILLRKSSSSDIFSAYVPANNYIKQHKFRSRFTPKRIAKRTSEVRNEVPKFRMKFTTNFHVWKFN